MSTAIDCGHLPDSAVFGLFLFIISAHLLFWGDPRRLLTHTAWTDVSASYGGKEEVWTQGMDL